jgi:hypothetical protein
MSGDAKKQAQEIAELKSKLVKLEEAVKAASPPAPVSAEEMKRQEAEWIDKMHQMREGRMSLATPPSVQRYFADGVTPADCADIRQQAHRPTGRPGMIPEQPSKGSASSPGTGWRDATPISPPPGINWVDAQCIADDVRQRAELKRKLGG